MVMLSMFANTPKKGQSATEFLMTYSWAILVMLGVVAALFYLGILNPQQMAPNSLNFPGGFSAHDFKVESTGGAAGNLTLDLGQGIGKSIELTGIACTNSASEPSNPSNLANVSIEPGEHKLIADNNITCTGASNGQYYQGKVYIWYRIADTTPDHRIVGDLSYKVE